jgi:hypothetical protein
MSVIKVWWPPAASTVALGDGHYVRVVVDREVEQARPGRVFEGDPALARQAKQMDITLLPAVAGRTKVDLDVGGAPSTFTFDVAERASVPVTPPLVLAGTNGFRVCSITLQDGTSRHVGFRLDDSLALPEFEHALAHASAGAASEVARAASVPTADGTYFVRVLDPVSNELITFDVIVGRPVTTSTSVPVPPILGDQLLLLAAARMEPVIPVVLAARKADDLVDEKDDEGDR